MSLFSDLLADPQATRHYLAILEPRRRSDNVVVPFYFSDHGFVTEPGDTPANTVFEPRIDASFAFSIARELFGSGRIGGRSLPNYGDLVLSNGDGGLDALYDDYNWDGAAITLLLGGDGFGLTDYGTIFTGTAAGTPAGDELVLRLRIQDLARKLATPVQTNTFGGTGGADGGADLAGKVRPLSYGRNRNVPGVYLGIIGGKDSWAVHDGAIDDVDAGWSVANALTKVAPVAGAGQYSVAVSTSVVTLGGSALGTVITWDVKGDKRGGTYRTTVADLVREIAVQRGGLSDPADIDTGSFTALNSACSAPVGIWIDQPREVDQVLDELCGSIGAWWGFSRAGQLQVGLIDEPAVSAAATYTPIEILEIERLEVALPIWRAVVSYARCWRVQSGTEIGAGASAAQQAFVQQADRDSAPVEDAAIRTAHPLAEEERRPTLLTIGSDADDFAQRLFDLLSVDRSAYKVKLKTQPFTRELGDTVALVYPRWDLAAGKNGVILGMIEDAAVNEVTITWWG